MALTKILPADLTGKGVVGLPDTPGLSTTEMQEKFDEIANDVLVPKHNALVDDLEATTGAGSIGALNSGGTASNVQAELDNRYTIPVTEQLLANKVDTEEGKGLTSNDFTDGFKFKLNGIEDNANNYVLPKGSQTSLGGVMGDGSTFTIDENGIGHAVGGGGGGTADYNALINKPVINGVTVSGNKDSEEYGLLRPYIVVTSEAGSTITISKGGETITGTQLTTTTWGVCPTSYGTWTVSSDLPGADIATSTITIDAVKTYAITVNHITATIAVTYESGAVCTCSKGSTVYTATSNPQTFTVRSIGNWVISVDYDGLTKTQTVPITADGQSESVTVEFADIEVTYGNAFRGTTITCSCGDVVYSKTAPSNANTVSFTIPSTGTWRVSGTVSGDTYNQDVVVSAMTSYSATLQVFNATVTVTFPYTEGASCTLSDGVTTLTATTSPMAFSVPNVGTWTATCTLDGQAKTDSVTITTDGQTETLSFSYGTINLTYDNEFRGLSITCTDSNSTITKTAPISGNTMAFYPPNTGTWTISGVYSSVTYSTTVTVSSLSTAVTAQLILIPNGSTVTPTDDIQKWLNCAGIFDKTSYTALSDILSDSVTFNALLGDSNANKYMARSTTWAVAEGKIPTMTSNTTPSGVASASAFFSTGYEAYKAFDKNSGTEWNSSGNESSSYLEYEFPTAQSVNRVSVVDFADGYSHNTSTTAKIQAYDGANWINISDAFGSSGYFSGIIYLNDTNPYTKFRIQQVSGSKGMSVKELQFYADDDITSNADAMCMIGQYDVCCDALLGNSTWASAIIASSYADYVITAKVPTMTSATAPSGEVVGNNYYDNNKYLGYWAFDASDVSFYSPKNNSATNEYIGYIFPSNVSISVITMYVCCGEASTTYPFIVQTYDGANWTDADTWTVTPPLGTQSGDNIGSGAVTLTHNGSYSNIRGIRLIAKDFSLSVPGTQYIMLGRLQFYGRVPQTEKIHGANEEVAYYLDGATQVPISNPSTLDAGTYTFGSTIAKNPDSLSSDYTKQIRITPNTVEVVLRPDKSLYWWGYESANLEDLSTANGWSGSSGISFTAPTHNTNDLTFYSSSGSYACGVGNKIPLTASKMTLIINSYSGSSYGTGYSSKALTQPNNLYFDQISATGKVDFTHSITDAYLAPFTLGSAASLKINAFLYE